MLLLLKIGVHIADVSYFVHENTVLDQWAAQRCTSTYLVHKVHQVGSSLPESELAGNTDVAALAVRGTLLAQRRRRSTDILCYLEIAHFEC